MSSVEAISSHSSWQSIDSDMFSIETVVLCLSHRCTTTHPTSSETLVDRLSNTFVSIMKAQTSCFEQWQFVLILATMTAFIFATVAIYFHFQGTQFANSLVPEITLEFWLHKSFSDLFWVPLMLLSNFPRFGFKVVSRFPYRLDYIDVILFGCVSSQPSHW